MPATPLLIFPLPEYGHLAPTLPIARHFSGSGHRVIYVAPAQFRDVVLSVGAELIPLLPGSDRGEAASGQRIWTQLAPEPSPGHRAHIITQRLVWLAGEYEDASFLLDRHLAETSGCNVEAALGARRRLYFSTSLLPWDEKAERLPKDPTLVFCPGELEVSRFRDRGPQWMYVEPSLHGVASAQSPIFDPRGRPLIVAVWGTQSARYTKLPTLLHMVVQLAQSRRDCFFLAGMSAHPGARIVLSGELPENLLVHEHIDQAQVLPEASVVLTHGGLGTIKECIAAAVPMVVLPFLADQPFNAIRVTEAGLGGSIFPEEQEFGRLERELDLALAGRYANALDRLQRIFLQREKEQPSRAIIERHLF